MQQLKRFWPLALVLLVVAAGAYLFLRSRTTSSASSTAASGYTPVSYTHLRAHETVLDLVCRLLLEKKKTDIQR